METISDRQEASIKSTAANLHREILPLLKSASQGQFVKGLLEEELYRHEMLFSHERVSPSRLCAVAVVALVAGFAIGSL